MKIPYLGKIKLYWCDSCQVPLINENCGLCEKASRRVTLSPPGDVRPAFKGDLKNIVFSIYLQFGESSAIKFQELIEKNIVLLNKVPYIDRMDEIIIQGHVVGLFRFNIIKDAFEFVPKLPLAKYIWSTNAKRYVTVDIGAKIPISTGSSVLSPGILYADINICVDDPVIVVCQNEVIAVGLAKTKGYKMGSGKKGVAIKTKYRKSPSIILCESIIANWKMVIDANHKSMDKLEREAIEFIEKVAENYNRHIVAYSGGKDSLVTLDLVSQSNVFFDIIFADTGLEYPETLDNVKIIGYKYQKKVLSDENRIWDFWTRFDEFGPPSRNSRWCCKSSKLLPVNRILEKNFPNEEKILSYIGRRRYESLGRSREKRVSKNPWIPKQITAAPINEWNALEVFLYIMKHNLTDFLNPLYDLGFIRIGCWICPASSKSDFKIMEKTHPKLINKLNTELLKIQNKKSLPQQYVSWGLWRWRYLPLKMQNLLKSKNIEYKSSFLDLFNNTELRFKILESPSPCVQGGFSALLCTNQMLDLSKIQRLISIIGSNQYNEELDILSINLKNIGRIDIFRDGSIIVKEKEKKNVVEYVHNIIQTLYRVTHCDGCGVCTYQCKNKALIIESNVVKAIGERCISCLNCNKYCPLLKYRDYNTFLYI